MTHSPPKSPTWGMLLQWYGAPLGSLRLWVQTPVLPKNKNKMQYSSNTINIWLWGLKFQHMKFGEHIKP
jgi:hypothetical protein